MIALVAVALLAVASEPAGATPVPTAAEIFARNRAAAGPAPAGPERESWIVRSAGLTGTLEVVRDGAARAATLTLGPFRTQRGIVDGQRWHQNDNGETVLERPEPSQAERSLTETVTRVREPADAWLITDSLASGHVTRTYYDARSYLLIRSETTVAGHATHIAFDGFRTSAGGRVRATHFFGGDDRPGGDFDYRLARDESVAQVDPAELAVPADRRTLVEFPRDVTSARLPARIEGGRVYVRLVTGGRALDFLLDSGASGLTLDETVARELGLSGYGRATEAVAGTFTAQRVIVPAVGIGPLHLRDVVMRTAPLAENEGSHTRVVGLLGFDFFAGAALRIDYAAGTVDAFARGTALPAPGSLALPIRLNAQVPVTTVTVGEATGDDFILDTGAQFDLVLFARFARAHGDAAATAGQGPVRYGTGVGGAVPYRPLAVKRVTLGPLAIAEPAAVLALEPAALGFDTKDGLVGSGLLQRFRVLFDYAGGRVYLEPSARGLSSVRPRAQASGRPERTKGSGRPGG